MKLKVEKEGGEDFDDTRKESGVPVDNILYSLWSSVDSADIELNHTLVSTSGTDYMYKALFENLLNYSSDAKEIQLSSIRFSEIQEMLIRLHLL